MILKSKDNAEGQLDASINAAATSLILKAGEGALFPQPTKDACTSLGSSTVLNRTGVLAALTNIEVGDPIFNITDGSQAWIVSITTNAIETTPLHGGSDNTWDNADQFVVKQFVITLNTRDADGNMTEYEEVLIRERTTDTIIAAASTGRGYNGTTPNIWDADTYVSLFVTSPVQEGVEVELYQIQRRKFENDLSQPVPNNTTLKGRNAANSANVDLLKLTSSDILEFQTLPRNFAGRSISNNYDLIDKKYFDDNVPTGGTITYPLYETLSAADLVKVFNDGGTAKIRELIPDADVAETLIDATAALGGCDAIEMAANKIVVAWATATITYAVCITISGTTLTVGTVAQVEPANSGKPTLCKLDTDKFVCVYEDRTDTDGTARAATISGTTITFGTAVDYNTTISGYGRVLQVATDKFIIFYCGGGTTLYCIVGNVSGTTITFGTEQNLDASITAAGVDYVNSAIVIGTNKFLFVSQSDSYYCTVSGTVVTASARSNISSLLTTPASLFKIDDTHFIVKETGVYHIWKHDGAGTETLIASQADTTLTNVIQLLATGEDKKFVILSTSGWRKGWLANGRMNYSRFRAFASTRNAQRATLFSSSNPNQFITIVSSNLYGFVCTYNDFEDFSGILQSGGTAGQTKAIATRGEASQVHSFAAADVNKIVYIQEDGTLGLTMTTFPIGRVYSTTTMIINT